ncbi:hypothetical protein [Echinicola rosea]|uniref:Uncharacterized protein n=1 Tax=Echinicola rosea TaxID=1807691 RepID=A0ABQ1VAT4_9BACT|nr:hypothetical protein [Echinicola rosea]GGF44050.1 hypothetical protein GCM10011339_35690 [Echinicola rosea]
MKIQDKDGNTIEVEDLDKAIEHAEMFSNYKLSGKASSFLKKRQAYWKDMLQKLKQVKKNK